MVGVEQPYLSCRKDFLLYFSVSECCKNEKSQKEFLEFGYKFGK